MSDHSKPDAKDMVRKPSTHFDTPAEVVETRELSRNEKAKALDNWEEDSRRLAVATEEGMTGGEPSRVTEVADAKAELGVKSRKSRSPTKAG